MLWDVWIEKSGKIELLPRGGQGTLGARYLFSSEDSISVRERVCGWLWRRDQYHYVALHEMSPGQKELVTMMEDISEEFWSAGWLSGLEYTLWKSVQDYRQGVEAERDPYYFTYITSLSDLAKKEGGWGIYPTWTPFDQNNMEPCFIYDVSWQKMLVSKFGR